MTVLEIPAQVWFLLAFGAVMVLLADTAVRSWRSPERVADPAFMWPRPAPVRSDRLIGPRLPGGSFRMPEPGLRYAVSPSGHAFFESVEAHPVPRPPLVVVPPAGAAFWSRVEGGAFESYAAGGEVVDTDPTERTLQVLVAAGAVEHRGASLDWSPIAEHEAAAAARLPLDDVDEWLAARLSDFDHTLAMISSRPLVSLVRGGVYRTVDEELAAFVDGSQRLHAYRVMRIGQTGEYQMIDAARVEALQVAA